ncbi:MAG TPA: efflux RND transporter periplasmic adaptor subunit, partial [Planctomycetota bacterium]|nr:efflux RND transporter periplasmic adaptor subunit [Planctomycetota bacterium]
MNPAIDTLNETLEVTTPAAAKNRRRPRYFIAAALVGAAALAVIGTLPRLERRAVLADAKVRVEASPRVSVVGPRPAPKEVVLTLPGGTQAIQDTTLYARTSGFLSQRMVDIGDRVEAGQLLAVIEAPELDQDLERASVHLEEARANLTLARSTLQRIRSLLQAHAVSEQEYDDQKVRVNSAEAAEKAGQADVRRLTALQSYERVVAPFAGTITARNVDKGALVTSGSGSSLSSLFSIADTSGLRVFIDVPQTAAAGIAEHQDAEVLLRELPGKVFRGKVVRTA